MPERAGQDGRPEPERASSAGPRGGAHQRPAGAAGRPRPRSFRVHAEVAVLWLVGLGAALAVAAETRVGPVAFGLTGTHGVHVGDLVFVAGTVLLCAGVTWVRMRR